MSKVTTISHGGAPLSTRQRECLNTWTSCQPGAKGPTKLFVQMQDRSGPITVRALRALCNLNHNDLKSRLQWLADRNFITLVETTEHREIVLLDPPPLSWEPVPSFRGNQFGISVVRCPNVPGTPLSLTMSGKEQQNLQAIFSGAGLTPTESLNGLRAYEGLRAVEGVFFVNELDQLLKGKRAAKRTLKTLEALNLIEQQKARVSVVTVFSPRFENLDRDLRAELLVEASELAAAASHDAINSPAAVFLDLYVAIKTKQGDPPSSLSRLRLLPVAQRLVAGGSFERIRGPLCVFLLNTQTFKGRIGAQLDRYGATLITFERNLDTILEECKGMAAPYRQRPDAWWKQPMCRAGLEEWCV